MRETASMALTRRQTLQRGSLAAVVPLLAPAPAFASTKTDAEKVLEALQPLSGFVDDGKWDAVRTVLSARQRARFEAAIALEAPSASPSLSGADLFDVMAADLDCSVEQIAAAYLGCVVVPGKARADATIAE